MNDKPEWILKAEDEAVQALRFTAMASFPAGTNVPKGMVLAALKAFVSRIPLSETSLQPTVVNDLMADGDTLRQLKEYFI